MVKYVFDVTNGPRKAVVGEIREDAGKLKRNELANGTPPFLDRKVLRRRGKRPGESPGAFIFLWDTRLRNCARK